MAEIVNHEIFFNCMCCGKTFHRPAESLDYCGKVVMPIGWGYWRICTDVKEFCESPECQLVLDRYTIGCQVDYNSMPSLCSRCFKPCKDTKVFISACGDFSN